MAVLFDTTVAVLLLRRRPPDEARELLDIAATAVWLDIPLLAWDGDYARSGRVAEASPSTHPGAGLWRRLHLHPASLGG